MNHDVLLNALNGLDGAWLDETLARRAKLAHRIGRRVNPVVWKRVSTLAACLAAVLIALPIGRVVFSGAHGEAPCVEKYDSVEAVEAVVGDGLLIGRLPPLLRGQITVSFPADENGNPNGEAQMLRMPLIFTEADNSLSTVDPVSYVNLYVFFDRDDLQSSVGGYEEQGLTRQYGEITVAYSLIEDGMMHGQAKFLYGGHLYVLDVSSTGDTHFLFKYLDMLLKEESSL